VLCCVVVANGRGLGDDVRRAHRFLMALSFLGRDHPIIVDRI
jgi:hypothetical protein